MEGNVSFPLHFRKVKFVGLGGGGGLAGCQDVR